VDQSPHPQGGRNSVKATRRCLIQVDRFRGAPPIDLIDGDRLCELLKRYDLGVQTTIRTVEDVGIDPAFFAEI
jgi:hypothetical protein